MNKVLEFFRDLSDCFGLTALLGLTYFVFQYFYIEELMFLDTDMYIVWYIITIPIMSNIIPFFLRYITISRFWGIDIDDKGIIIKGLFYINFIASGALIFFFFIGIIIQELDVHWFRIVLFYISLALRAKLVIDTIKESKK